MTSGYPTWLDLMTDDVDDAKRFYGELFGWTFDDQGADFGHYNTISCDGELVGGLMTTKMRADGPTEEPSGPTTWTIYLQTADIAAAVEQLEGVGAQLLMGPMEIADHGTQAYIIDPAGAYLALWQPNRMPGMVPSEDPGRPIWFETLTKDYDAALPFYRDVLGWDVVPMDMSETGSPNRYATNGAGADASAGICEVSHLPAEVPSFWRPYFSVADADATVAKAAELGATVDSEPMDSPFGRFAQLRDPQGAIFMVNQNPVIGG